MLKVCPYRPTYTTGCGAESTKLDFGCASQLGLRIVSGWNNGGGGRRCVCTRWAVLSNKLKLEQQYGRDFWLRGVTPVDECVERAKVEIHGTLPFWLALRPVADDLG